MNHYNHLLRDISEGLLDHLFQLKVETYQWILSDITGYMLAGDGVYPNFWDW